MLASCGRDCLFIQCVFLIRFAFQKRMVYLSTLRSCIYNVSTTQVAIDLGSAATQSGVSQGCSSPLCSVPTDPQSTATFTDNNAFLAVNLPTPVIRQSRYTKIEMQISTGSVAACLCHAWMLVIWIPQNGEMSHRILFVCIDMQNVVMATIFPPKNTLVVIELAWIPATSQSMWTPVYRRQPS